MLDAPSTLPSIDWSSVSRISRFASSSGVSFPVSIHQPVSSWWSTRWPLSISHWMASVISSSPRADGWMARTASCTVRVEQVDADQGQVGRRVDRLLDQAHDALTVELGHAEALGVGHLVQADLGAGAAAVLEAVDDLLQALLQHVVAEVHHEVVVAEEVAGDQHAVGQAERRVLGDVGDLDPPPRAVAHRGHDLVARVAHHDADLGCRRRPCRRCRRRGSACWPPAPAAWRWCG